MAQLDFTGKTVLVSGGSTGIGNAAARAFRAAGAEVHVTGTRAAAADYAGEPGDLDGLHYHRLDMSDGAGVNALAAQFPLLDVLVVAGARVLYRRQEFDPDAFAAVVDTNLVGPMRLVMALRAALGARRGSIIMVGSVASFRGVIAQPAYSASKGGMLTLTRSLAMALGPKGIRVNLVAPGLVRTRMTQVTFERPERVKANEAMVPLGRLGEPEDLAGPILFLASDAAAYVSGTSLVVDGGMSA
jgi:3-oxoacyl-[acyl-carrier protein] reductase